MKSPTPPPGMIADRWRVERVLGEGGGGIVVEAIDLQTQSAVAIKLLRGASSKNAETVARFLREAQVASQLKSEHVARVSEVGTLPSGEPFMVMELLHGNDLQEELAMRGSFSIPDAVDVVLQASKALAEAHALGLVHRDVKPANLFLAKRPDGSRIVKIIDFGLTKDSNVDLGITATASVLGTPQYMSPEQLRSSKHVDARVDQHALGMVLIELITGAPAFQADSPTALMIEIGMHDAPRLRSRLADAPQALDDAIARALAKEPDDRYADLAAFARALGPFGGANAPREVATIELLLQPRDIGEDETQVSDPRASDVAIGHASHPILDARLSGAPVPPPPRPIIDEGPTVANDAPTQRIDPEAHQRVKAEIAARLASAPQYRASQHSSPPLDVPHATPLAQATPRSSTTPLARRLPGASPSRSQIVAAGAIAGGVALVMAIVLVLVLRGGDASTSSDPDASISASASAATAAATAVPSGAPAVSSATIDLDADRDASAATSASAPPPRPARPFRGHQPQSPKHKPSPRDVFGPP